MMPDIDSDKSTWACTVTFGVQHGSVLWFMVSILYSADLINIIATLGSQVHQYVEESTGELVNLGF